MILPNDSVVPNPIDDYNGEAIDNAECVSNPRVLKIDDYDAPSRDKSLGFGLAPRLGG
jgi:hypothetical protein